MTSTSAYLAACAAATQPLMRTVFFFPATSVAMSHSARSTFGRTLSFLIPETKQAEFLLNIFCRAIRQQAQLFRLASVAALRNRERRIHSNDSRVEIQFGHALEAPGRALLDTNAAAFAVVDENLVQPIRTHRAHNTR